MAVLFTENGFEDERFRDPGYQVVKRKDLPDLREDMDEKAFHQGL